MSITRTRRWTSTRLRVVCLPYEHHGGKLKLTHEGNETEISFEHNSNNSIQWVAFYSHIEHEVEAVKSGYRVTLSYVLRWQNDPSKVPEPLQFVSVGEQDEFNEREMTFLRYNKADLAQCEPAANHFVDAIVQALKCNEFLPEGGDLIISRHLYETLNPAEAALSQSSGAITTKSI